MSESEKFQLNLQNYTYPNVQSVRNKENGKIEEEEEEVEVDVRNELYMLLRGNGCCKSGPEIVEAVTLARMIRDRNEDVIGLVKEDYELLKKILNYYISRENRPEFGMASLGGPRYEELILRVFG